MDFINNNANIFFFVTTILFIIFIILFVILLMSAIKIYRFVVKVIKQGDVMLEEVKTNNFVKKAAPMILPVILPVVSFFYKLQKTKRK